MEGGQAENARALWAPGEGLGRREPQTHVSVRSLGWGRVLGAPLPATSSFYWTRQP